MRALPAKAGSVEGACGARRRRRRRGRRSSAQRRPLAGPARQPERVGQRGGLRVTSSGDPGLVPGVARPEVTVQGSVLARLGPEQERVGTVEAGQLEGLPGRPARQEAVVSERGQEGAGQAPVLGLREHAHGRVLVLLEGDGPAPAEVEGRRGRGALTRRGTQGGPEGHARPLPFCAQLLPLALERAAVLTNAGADGGVVVVHAQQQLTVGQLDARDRDALGAVDDVHLPPTVGRARDVEREAETSAGRVEPRGPRPVGGGLSESGGTERDC